MKLVLLRHGMTMANERRLYCGASDLALTAAGRAELLRLRREVSYPDAADLEKITSGMLRSDETLKLLYGVEPDRRMPGFREIHFGSFELKCYEELKGNAQYQAWICDDTGDAAPPGGESANAFRARVFAAVDTLERDALIVCHGGVIAALMARWFPEEGRNLYQWQPGFGLGYVVELGPGARSYTALNG